MKLWKGQEVQNSSDDDDDFLLCNAKLWSGQAGLFLLAVNTMMTNVLFVCIYCIFF